MIDISVVAGIIAVVAAVIVELISVYSFRKKRAARREVTPGERIQQSISKLNSVTQEIDAIIQDIVRDIKSRQTVLEDLKTRHQTLSQEEAELSKRVKILKDLPLEVAKYFQQISEQTLQQMEKKRARRDILMFVLGIVVTTVIAILLRFFGVG
jgi:archaellum component FlaC